MFLKKVSSLLSDGIAYGGSNLIGQVINFVLLPLYTRFLTPTDYGVIAILAIWNMIFSPIANHGMTSAIFRFFNTNKDPQKRSEVLFSGVISVLISSILLGGICLLMASPLTAVFLKDLQYVGLFKLTIYTSVFLSIGEIPNVILRADRRVKAVAFLNIVGVLITVTTTIGLVVGLKMQVAGVVYANMISAAALMVFKFLFSWRDIRGGFDRGIWKKMVRYGLPIVPHRIQALGLAQFGLYMIGNMIGLDQAGIYGIAIKISMPLTFIVGAIQQAWVPFKFQIYAEDESPGDFFSSIVTYYVAGVSYLWVGLCAWGPELIRLMTDGPFHGAIAILSMVSLIPLCQGLYWMLGTGYMFDDNIKSLPVVSLCGLVVVVCSAFIAIPFFGAFGAALATALGWITMTIVIYFLSQKRYKIHYDWLPISIIGGLALSFAVVTMLIQSQSLSFRIFANIGISILYPALLFVVVSFLSSEKERMLFVRQRLIDRYASLINRS